MCVFLGLIVIAKGTGVEPTVDDFLNLYYSKENNRNFSRFLMYRRRKKQVIEEMTNVDRNWQDWYFFMLVNAKSIGPLFSKYLYYPLWSKLCRDLKKPPASGILFESKLERLLANPIDSGTISTPPSSLGVRDQRSVEATLRSSCPLLRSFSPKKSERSERQPRLRMSLRPWCPGLFRPSIPLLSQPKLLNNDQRRNDGSRREKKTDKITAESVIEQEVPQEVHLVNLHAGSNLISDRDLAVKVANHLLTDIKRELAKEGRVPMGLDEGGWRSCDGLTMLPANGIE
ncbi:hypothetical protein TIFTF001_017722 [Ficus carica]|uniref:Uncharacterized protein n=1 Tax=Ficus carica TaxID=3494 RepID=A0AA88A9U1_FICCA|nr:hypothetical protein TIFTF001_017722 [Ficus carica]